MKLYDYPPAPNPRRVRIFLAEKGIEVPTEAVDLRQGAQLSEAFRRINPQCVVPYLVLDDGTGISESIAICRYFEALQPDPPLFGKTPLEQALVEMWSRRAEFEGLLAVADALRNSAPAFKNRALPGADDFEQIPALVERGQRRTKRFFDVLEERLAHSTFLAGDFFSVADITAFVTVDFAGWIKLTLPETHINARRWYETVRARPSASA
ncbi:glutathione S-transferase family protein [Tepidiphilus olei]|uniref:glutathione S-transferase family protein n=1 Tax=Tepidiphilus olei TaxID=2502184 RepID=UPI00115C827E|nr:glutathione S-transferase [Tepidiphilus olei]